VKDTKSYESFPMWIVFSSNLVAISIYIIGAYILAGLGVIFSALYLFYCLLMEIMILRRSCVDCYYYGKVCGLGKGKLCSLLFKKGKPERFVKKEVSLTTMLPDFMVSIFPLLGGIILLIRNFTWLLVAVMVILVVLSFGGNAVVRGLLVCRYCKQRKIGCPAEKLFSKGKETKQRMMR